MYTGEVMRWMNLQNSSLESKVFSIFSRGNGIPKNFRSLPELHPLLKWQSFLYCKFFANFYVAMLPQISIFRQRLLTVLAIFILWSQTTSVLKMTFREALIPSRSCNAFQRFKTINNNQSSLVLYQFRENILSWPFASAIMTLELTITMTIQYYRTRS